MEQLKEPLPYKLERARRWFESHNLFSEKGEVDLLSKNRMEESLNVEK